MGSQKCGTSDIIIFLTLNYFIIAKRICIMVRINNKYFVNNQYQKHKSSIKEGGEENKVLKPKISFTKRYAEYRLKSVLELRVTQREDMPRGILG